LTETARPSSLGSIVKHQLAFLKTGETEQLAAEPELRCAVVGRFKAYDSNLDLTHGVVWWDGDRSRWSPHARAPVLRATLGRAASAPAVPRERRNDGSASLVGCYLAPLRPGDLVRADSR
jgi:hypothetical protein